MALPDRSSTTSTASIYDQKKGGGWTPLTFWIMLFFSIIEGLYAVYMLREFKTRWEIHHPLEATITGWHNYIKHPIWKGGYGSKICPLGHQICMPWLFWFAIRVPFFRLRLTRCMVKELNTHGVRGYRRGNESAE